MSTKIEWVQAQDGARGESWNPVTGCSPCSAGCLNCYAGRMAQRLKGRYGYPKDNPFRVTFHPDKLNQPLRWKKPRRIFTVSMGDLFHKDVKWNWQYKIFEIMVINQNHTYLVLTKRPERMQKVLADVWFHLCRNYPWLQNNLPLKNVWIGITAENQEMADKRIPILLQIPAAVRFISVEPMLSDIDLKLHDYAKSCGSRSVRRQFLNWILCGTESGAKRRPAKIEWIRNLKDQCVSAGIPFFMKQIEHNDRVSHNMDEWPDDLGIREFPSI